jgi:hypothetical protein
VQIGDGTVTATFGIVIDGLSIQDETAGTGGPDSTSGGGNGLLKVWGCHRSRFRDIYLYAGTQNSAGVGLWLERCWINEFYGLRANNCASGIAFGDHTDGVNGCSFFGVQIEGYATATQSSPNFPGGVWVPPIDGSFAGGKPNGIRFFGGTIEGGSNNVSGVSIQQGDADISFYGTYFENNDYDIYLNHGGSSEHAVTVNACLFVGKPASGADAHIYHDADATWLLVSNSQFGTRDAVEIASATARYVGEMNLTPSTVEILPASEGVSPFVFFNRISALEYMELNGLQFLSRYIVGHQAPTVSGNAVTVDLADGNSALIDMDPATGNVTLTLSNPPPTGTYGEVNLTIVMGTPAYGINWPGSVVWQGGGLAPTLTTTDNVVDLVHLYTLDAGTTWYGTYALAAEPSGGDVAVSGTPVDNQVAIWTAADTIEGDASLTYNGTTLEATQFAGIAKANLVDKTAAETISGKWTSTAEGTTGSGAGSINITAGNPSFNIDETDAPTDERNTLLFWTGGDFQWRLYDDAWSATNNAFTMTRSGNSLDTFTVNGALTATIKDYGITHTAPTVSGNAVTLDCENGNSFLVDMDPATANVTLTLSNPPASGTYGEVNLIVVMGTPAFNILWPGSVTWATGTEPLLDSTDDAVTLVHLFTVDGGTTWYGTSGGGGGGEVSISGTPANDQIAIWVGVDSIEGDANFTYDGSTLKGSGIDATFDAISASGAVVDVGQVGQLAFLDVAGSNGRVGSYNFDTTSWQPIKVTGSGVELEAVSGGVVAVIDGGTFRIENTGGTKYLDAYHNGTNMILDGTSTTNIYVDNVPGGFGVLSGGALSASDSDNDSSVSIYNTGTDGVIEATNSTALRLKTADTIVEEQLAVNKVSGSGNYSIEINSTVPGLEWWESDAVADSKRWQMVATSAGFIFRTRTDVDGVGQTIFSVSRTAAAVDELLFSGATWNTFTNDIKARSGLQVAGGASNTGVDEQIAFIDVNAGKARFGSYNWDSAAWQPTLVGGSTLEFQAASGITVSNDTDFVDNALIRPEIKDYGVTHTAPTVSANAVTVDCENGNSFLIDMDPATAAVTLTLSNPPASGTYGEVNLIIVMGTPAHGMTWPGSVTWQGGTAPVLTSTDNGVDLIHLFTVDGGTTWYGTFSLNDAADTGLSATADEVITGAWEFHNSDFGAFIIDRISDTGGSAIKYQNNDGAKGYAGFDDSGNFTVWDGAIALTGFTVSSTGVVDCDGITFGATVASGPTDLSNHIALYSTTYGFNITSNSLNMVAAGTNFMTGTATGINVKTDLNLTDNTLDQPVIQDYAIESSSEVISSNNATLTYADGPAFELDLAAATANVTVTISGGPPANTYGEIIVKIKQDTTARTITWAGGTFEWPGGVQPTLTATSGAFDIFHFSTWDGGTTWWGTAAQDMK